VIGPVPGEERGQPLLRLAAQRVAQEGHGDVADDDAEHLDRRHGVEHILVGLGVECCEEQQHEPDQGRTEEREPHRFELLALATLDEGEGHRCDLHDAEQHDEGREGHGNAFLLGKTKGSVEPI